MKPGNLENNHTKWNIVINNVPTEAYAYFACYICFFFKSINIKKFWNQIKQNGNECTLSAIDVEICFLCDGLLNDKTGFSVLILNR